MKMYVNHNQNRRRHGLSLFEILASLFVLMVGLLGVLAVLPFGLFQMNRVNKADFGGNCGRAAIQEIQIRNWAGSFEDSLDITGFTLDPYGYNTAQRRIGILARKVGTTALEPFIRTDRPLVIDPLLVEMEGIGSQYLSRVFPGLDLSDGPDNNINGYDLSAPYLPRLTCALSPSPPPPANWSGTLPEWVNQSRKKQSFDAFYWKDDRNFAAPASPNIQVPRPVGVVGSDNHIQSHENYSWFYMLTPQIRQGTRYGIVSSPARPGDPYVFGPNSASPYSLESDVIGYDVDVVVFFDRNTNLDTLGTTERSVPATRDGISNRGGSFTISGTTEELDLTDTRYLLLTCNVPNPSGGTMVFAKWYRIVNFGDLESPATASDPYTRKLMLLGPDIPDNVLPGFSATLIQGTIHVYSTTIKK